MAKKTPAQMKATRKYDEKTYALIQIRPRKEFAEKLRSHAAERGESVTGFLVRAAETQIEIDICKKEPDAIKETDV